MLNAPVKSELQEPAIALREQRREGNEGLGANDDIFVKSRASRQSELGPSAPKKLTFRAGDRVHEPSSFTSITSWATARFTSRSRKSARPSLPAHQVTAVRS